MLKSFYVVPTKHFLTNLNIRSFKTFDQAFIEFYIFAKYSFVIIKYLDKNYDNIRRFIYS
jgi:hypothetical protein